MERTLGLSSRAGRAAWARLAQETRHRGLALGLLLAVLLSGYRFYRLRHWVDFTDENDNVAVGWLLTRGERLYGTVFSHHMPGAYAAAAAVAWIAPTDHVSRTRAVTWLLYALVALALFRSPLHPPGRGLFAASTFLVLASLLLPHSFGHMLLADSLWGGLFTLAVVLLLLPYLSGAAPSRRASLVAGAAAAAAVSTALMAVFPLALAVLGSVLVAAASRVHRASLARVAGPFLIGSSATGLLFVLWVVRFGDLAGLVEQALVFNVEIYGPLCPDRTAPGGLVAGTLGDWAAWLAHAPQTRAPRDASALFALLSPLAVLAGSAATGKRPLRVRAIAALTLLGTVLLTRTRGSFFHELPCQILLLALLSSGLASLWRAPTRWLSAAGLSLVALLAIHVTRAHPSLVACPPATTSHPWRAIPAAVYVRERTAPEERVLALNVTPGFYLFAQRRPATDSVFYLPWQAWWESRHARVNDTLEQLRRSPPRFVFYRPETVWGLYPFESYAAEIDRLIRSGYREVHPELFGGYLRERRPDFVPPSGHARRATGSRLPRPADPVHRPG